MRQRTSYASFLAGAFIAFVAWACVDGVRGCAVRLLRLSAVAPTHETTPTMRVLLLKIGCK